ncbi:MAG TPA: DNA modification methylase [Candidatus Paceibacterota bacterium]|nr:DNA modification methylase [Candidatus Paceibacterota bacterium]
MENKLNITYAPISQLRASEYNPRSWSKDAITQLTESIKRYGFVDPLLVNGAPKRKGIVIGGHFRLSIAKKLGITEVPVVYINIPDIAREKELNIRLNKNVGDWDWDLLAKFDPTLLTNIGFSGEELDEIFDIGEVVEDFDVEKELKKIKKPVSKLGDLYQLGSHRIICGDSTDPAVIRRLMSGKKADSILQDPPYNIALDYDKGIGGKGNYGGTVDDAKSDSEYKKFLKSALQNALGVLKKDAHVFTYCDQKYIWLLQTLYTELGIANKRVCLWIKNNSTPTPQVAFNKQYEPCVYGTVGKPHLSQSVLNLTEILNREIGTGNRAIEDIYDLLDIWMVKRLNGTSYEHPTEKPAALHEKALRRCTKPGQIVLDCFAGSGSLMVACEQLKRTAYMIEREPIFVDLVIRRYEKLTGHKAIKV